MANKSSSESTVLCMREKNAIKVLAILVVILVAVQGFTIYLILIKANQAVNRANTLESALNQRLEETNSNLQTLTEQVVLLTSAQSDIQEQVAQIKATTSADFSGIIEEAIQGTVTIKTDVAQGTGFIMTQDGYILTNAHVLSGGHYAYAYTYDSERYSAKLIGYDLDLDIAVLKIEGSFSKLDLGDSDSVKLGEKVIAIGNPLGLSFSTSEGIISARDREGDNNLPYYFQTDASLNPGNSGGPLIDTNGEVIGINNFKISGAESLGFALEINYARDTVNEITLKALNMTIV